MELLQSRHPLRDDPQRPLRRRRRIGPRKFNLVEGRSEKSGRPFLECGRHCRFPLRTGGFIVIPNRPSYGCVIHPGKTSKRCVRGRAPFVADIPAEMLIARTEWHNVECVLTPRKRSRCRTPPTNDPRQIPANLDSESPPSPALHRLEGACARNR